MDFKPNCTVLVRKDALRQRFHMFQARPKKDSHQEITGMDKTELFEKAPIHKAVINMALPTILSMIVIILYNMADTFL